MSTTYLELTNELLRELNEVTLTVGTFQNAVGVQQHVKDALNRSYFDIINQSGCDKFETFSKDDLKILQMPKTFPRRMGKDKILVSY